MNNHLDGAYRAATELGLITEGFELDGEWHRVPVVGKRASNRSGAYCLRLLNLRSGAALVVGVLWNHVTSQSVTLQIEGAEGTSAEDLALARAEAKRLQAESGRERARAYAETAERAQKIWGELPDSGASPYLQRKHVMAWGLRFSRGSVVVPVCDVEGALWSLQFIAPDGGKKFLSGGAKRGRFHRVGPDRGEPKIICICEGYATAATVYQCLIDGRDACVVAAFDAGNLAPVGEALSARWPKAKVVFFADNDAYGGYPEALIRERDNSVALRRVLDRFRARYSDVPVELVPDDDARLCDREKHFNTGVTQALLAAARVNGEVCVPLFDGSLNHEGADGR